MKVPLVLDSSQTEQIIKLRVQLARSKSKQSKYDSFISKMQTLDQQISQFLEQFNSRDGMLYDICQLLGIPMQPQKVIWKDGKRKNKWENSQYLQEIVYKHQEVLNSVQREEVIIRRIEEMVEGIVGKNRQQREKFRLLEKDHEECAARAIFAHKHSERVKVVESELKVKEKEINELKRIRSELEYRLEQTNNKFEEQESRMRELQREVEQKRMQIQKVQQKDAEEQQMTFHKQRVMQKCQNLVEMLQVGEEDYLTHYFKSNTLPLEVQRPNKNKYSMVFD